MLFYLELKNMNKKKNITAAVILAAILVIVDQITKYAVVKKYEYRRVQASNWRCIRT